jgi:hypothetical protein
MIFVSFDSLDRNWVALLVSTLRAQNQNHEFFWTGDPLPPGQGWFQFIGSSLKTSKGIISVITNNSTGTNNWINFEGGAAIGGDKPLLVLFAPGITIDLDVSRPLRNLQLVGWSNRDGIREGLKRLSLDFSDAAIGQIVDVFTPFSIERILYGNRDKIYEFTPEERQKFSYVLENRKELIIGNHLIGGRDPAYGAHKTIFISVARNNTRYEVAFPEESLLRRSDLYQ